MIILFWLFFKPLRNMSKLKSLIFVWSIYNQSINLMKDINIFPKITSYLLHIFLRIKKIWLTKIKPLQIDFEDITVKKNHLLLEQEKNSVISTLSSVVYSIFLSLLPISFFFLSYLNFTSSLVSFVFFIVL